MADSSFTAFSVGEDLSARRSNPETEIRGRGPSLWTGELAKKDQKILKRVGIRMLDISVMRKAPSSAESKGVKVGKVFVESEHAQLHWTLFVQRKVDEGKRMKRKQSCRKKTRRRL